MALRYITTHDPVSVPSLVIVIVGSPDSGKTTLANSFGTHLFDFDKGAHRAEHRRVTTIQVDGWRDVEEATAALAGGHQGVTIDTLERAITLLKQQLLRENSALGADGELYPRGHSILRRRFADWLARLRQGGPVLVVAHAKEERTDRGTRIRMDLPAGVRAELEKVAEFIGHVRRVNARRELTFDAPGFEGKNPGLLLPQPVPPVASLETFMADVFARGRAALEAKQAETARLQGVIETWRRELATYTTVDQFNLALPRFRALKSTDPGSYEEVYERFRGAARRAGLKFDVESDRFVAGGGFSETSQTSEKPPRVASFQPRLSTERAS